uniref:Uncharacterized protein n=1 Tax=Tanacetum cinerariifolium TaxID=118510 RepID=A0A6L2K7W6_TANCI|nr:hypothetical protein [Tanacetum cinerariifolium]
MEPPTFFDTYNMIAFVSKSDASAGFDQIEDFLNSQVIQYALMVNPTIYVSCIKQFCASATIKKVNHVVKFQALIDKKKVVSWHVWVRRNHLQVDILQGVFLCPMEVFKSNVLVRKGLPGTNSVVPWPRLSSALPQVESLIFLSTSLKACIIDSQAQEVREEEEIKVFMVEEIKKGGGGNDNATAKEVNAAEPTLFDDEEVTMTMAQTLIKMKAKKARILNEQMAKRLHDKEVKQAADREKQEKKDLERAKVLQQQCDQKQENIDWNVVAEQIQEKHLENIRKYQSLKRKPIFVAQARKTMIIYLTNMARYKKEHFKGMNYDQVRPIFEREYNKVQTLFIPDKCVEEPLKKRVTKETLLQESFKKLKAVEVLGSHSTQHTPTVDPKEMSEEDVQNML